MFRACANYGPTRHLTAVADQRAETSPYVAKFRERAEPAGRQVAAGSTNVVVSYDKIHGGRRYGDAVWRMAERVMNDTNDWPMAPGRAVGRRRDDSDGNEARGFLAMGRVMRG